MVEFVDGSIIAQLSPPDMKIPISYALNYPKRLENKLPSLNLAKIRELTFLKPDSDKFLCLDYAYEAIRKGGTMPTVLNASNEIAVQSFLKRDIAFLDIPRVIRETMNNHNTCKVNKLEDVLQMDKWARQRAMEIVAELKKDGKKSSIYTSNPEKNIDFR